MANATQITVNFSDAPSQTFNLVPTGPTVQTPFGAVNMATPGPAAQDPIAFSNDPSSHDGDAEDMTKLGMGPRWYDPAGIPDDGYGKGAYVNLGVYKTWADFYRDKPVQAERYWLERFKVALNINKLGPDQTRRMGL